MKFVIVGTKAIKHENIAAIGIVQEMGDYGICVEYAVGMDARYHTVFYENQKAAIKALKDIQKDLDAQCLI